MPIVSSESLRKEKQPKKNKGLSNIVSGVANALSGIKKKKDPVGELDKEIGLKVEDGSFVKPKKKTKRMMAFEENGMAIG